MVLTRVQAPHVMKKVLAFALLVFTLCTPARAGLVDLLNGAKLGRPLPPSDLQYLSAVPNLQDKLTLIDFWATWCAPCREAIPQLNAFQEKYSDRGLVVVGVSEETREEVAPFLLQYPMKYPHAIEGSKSLHKALKIKVLPYAIFVDRSGKIFWRGQPSDISDDLIVALLGKAGTGS